MVITVLREHRLALEAAEATVMEDMGFTWLRIERSLRDDVEALAREFARRAALGEEITEQMIRLDSRYRILEEQLQDQITRFNTGYAPGYISSAQERYANLGIQAAQDALRATYIENGMIPVFDKINIGAVESMMGFAGDGSPLKDLLSGDYGLSSADEMIQALIDGLARGSGPSAIADAMQEATGMELDRALLIARTEAARAYRTSSTEQYRTSGVTVSYKRLVKKETACIACLFLDGETLDSASELEDHPNGKCMVVPVVEGVEPPAWETGKDWFESLPDDRQENILGEERYNLYKSGTVSLDQMVGKTENATWGAAPQPLPLRDLGS
jgi:hypothetical protein